MDVQVRIFERNDIPFALEQTEREGWDTTSGFLETLLAHDPGGCFIAVCERQQAGMVTTTRYADSAWIGNLIVPPQFRKGSIGSTLMEHAIRHLEASGVQCIRLEADPLGIHIYRRLGFQDEFDSPRFRNDQPVFRDSSKTAQLHESDLPAACELDRRLFGDDRSGLLKMLFQTRVAACRVPRTGRITGFAFLQNSKAGYRLGPWIAESGEIAEELLRSAGIGLSPRPIIVAIPGVNTAGQDLLPAHGFRRTPSSLRMVRGVNLARGLPECIYALAGGAVG